MTHLRRLLRSSLAESAAARALMKCIQVASMLLASSKFGTKAQSALGCTAGLTTWTEEHPESSEVLHLHASSPVLLHPEGSRAFTKLVLQQAKMMRYRGENTPSSAAAAA